MSVVIKAEKISKMYQLGEIGTGTISRDLERWISRLLGKEDPFLKIGETNDRTIKGKSDYVWSLKDINFEINQGDAVGIIGRNGAGKSTLLKILSRVTSPTSGKITGKGRVASLLEVGTGFNPELTGRENIYLNGAILGMRKKEISRKFAEIVDFAGVERYIDTPVKRYSSGMYVRLAFAVAAHLDSDILIIDEVLAVGDAEFQKKCLGKMKDVSSGEGRTVLFVSHNMGSISSLCNKAVLLKNGTVQMEGRTHEVIKGYNTIDNNSHQLSTYNNNNNKKTPYFSNISISNLKSDINVMADLNNSFSSNKPIAINMIINNIDYQKNIAITIVIRDEEGNRLVQSTDEFGEFNSLTDKRICKIPENILKEGKYFLTCAVGSRFGELYEKLEDILQFSINYEGKLKGKELNLKGLMSPEIVLWEN